MRAVLVAASVLVWLQMAEAETYSGRLNDGQHLNKYPAPVASHVTKVQLRLKKRSWTCTGGLTATIKFGTTDLLKAKSAGGMWSHTFDPPLALSAGTVVVLLNTNSVCDFDYTFILDITADLLVPTPIPTPRPASSAGLCTSTTNSDFVGLMACGDSTCRTIVRYPVGQQTELCDPCASGPLGVYATITRSGPLYTLATGGLTMSSTCGQCTSIGKIQFDVPCGSGLLPTATPVTSVPMPIPTHVPTPRPASSGGLCTSTTNSDFVEVTGCGAAACRTTVRYPLGQRTQLCDSCIRGPLGVYATISRHGSGYTLAIDGQQTVSVPCGQCTSLGNLHFDVPCHTEDTNMLLIVLPIVGGVVALVAIGLGVWWCRRSTPAGEVKAVQEQQVSTDRRGRAVHSNGSRELSVPADSHIRKTTSRHVSAAEARQ